MTFSSVGVGVSDPVSAGVCEMGVMIIGVVGFHPLHPPGPLEEEELEDEVFSFTVTVAVCIVVFPSESVTV